ncbi:hypothetical protein [Chryseobacterium oncorhynchi]|uniref:Uncharacterized protein n=1 Tax=Chryseobacterium oncorhynchi TaxID=741074 RepID=A0A316WN95_9FLAO|nr:hypothetical protein [Chryseobacterium oncorhynchi]PWN60010.1 hypothetical protein C1638_020810 [Chryseobacterium oncorhynchi]
MEEKKLYSADEVQTILKKSIEATSKGIFEFINNESVIVDKLHKIEIPGAILETNYTSQKKASEYIDQELAKVGIIYNKQS